MAISRNIKTGVKCQQEAEKPLNILEAKEPQRPEDKPIPFEWAEGVKSEAAKYLWFPYLIDCNTNVFGGEAGTGKTWNLTAIIAAVTNNIQPEGMPGIVERRGNVLYLGGEDGNSAMRSRLEDLGADLSKVALVEKSFNCKSAQLETLVDAVNPVLIIFDPLLSYFPKGCDPNRYTGAREVMDYLRDFARERKTCIVCVVHPSKKDDYRLIHRFTGSGGFVDAVRAVTYVGYHPTDGTKRVGIQPKNNIIDTAPYVFQLDKELGFTWCGDDENITAKEVEQAMRLSMGKSGNFEYYVKVITEVMKIHPEGIHLTAGEILKEYKKVIYHEIDAKSFGRALAKTVMRNELAKHGIAIGKGANSGNRQRYRIYYESFDLMGSNKK